MGLLFIHIFTHVMNLPDQLDSPCFQSMPRVSRILLKCSLCTSVAVSPQSMMGPTMSGGVGEASEGKLPSLAQSRFFFFQKGIEASPNLKSRVPRRHSSKTLHQILPQQGRRRNTQQWPRTKYPSFFNGNKNRERTENECEM